MQVRICRQRETCPLSSVPESDLSPVSFINPALCAPLQKPGLFCKAAESVGGHTEPVGGSPPGHCWPWLSSQRPRGDWQDPLQKLPQGPGRARVRLQSHTGRQSVRNGETDKSEDGGLCCSWIYRLSGKRDREREKHWQTKAYICVRARPVMDNTLWTERWKVVRLSVSGRCERSTCRPITTGRGEPVPAVDPPSPPPILLSFKNLSEDGLQIFFPAFPLDFLS